MCMIANWKIEIGKDGTPYVVWNNGVFGEQRASPESKDITVTDRGISFYWFVRGKIQNYTFPFAMLAFEIPPIARSSTAQPHVLSFLYEVIFSVLTEKCPVILKKTPLDIEALLAKYDAFRDQLEGLDYDVMASRINLKRRGSF